MQCGGQARSPREVNAGFFSKYSYIRSLSQLGRVLAASSVVLVNLYLSRNYSTIGEMFSLYSLSGGPPIKTIIGRSAAFVSPGAH